MRRFYGSWPKGLGGLAIAAMLAIGFAACSDDDGGGTGGTGTTTPQDQVTEGLTDLADFGQNTVNQSQVQLLLDPRFLNVLNPLPFPSFPAQGLSKVLLSQTPNAQMAYDFLTYAVQKGKVARQGNDISDYYGTYQYDEFDDTAPFPGWALVNANSPDDGFILQFAVEDEFIGLENGEPVSFYGEIRLLDIVIDEGVAGPEDDLITELVFEVAAAPTGDPLTTFFRILLDITLDGSRELTRLAVGDPEASSTGDPGASYIGTGLFAMGVGFTPSVTAKQGAYDVDLFFQLYDTVERFALRFAIDAFGLVETLEGDTEVDSVGIEFSFGRTNNPSMPPWVMLMTMDNFREVPPGSGDEIIDISGSITDSGVLLATFSGDTTEVPVDINGDDVIDEGETCANVQITFSGSEESQNVCSAFAELVGLLDGAVPVALTPLVR